MIDRSRAAFLAAMAAIATAAAPEPLEELPVEPRREAPGAQQEAPPTLPFSGRGPEMPVGKPADPGDPARYRRCLDAAALSPGGALDDALAWQSAGGGLPAAHCIAVALFGLERYDPAAERLDELAQKLRIGSEIPADPLGGVADVNRLLAEVYAQRGNALLLAGRPAQAYTAFSNALAEAPPEALHGLFELYIDRARASGALGDFEAALADLERAQEIDSRHADLALYMASAQRALGRLDAAAESAERAVEIGGEAPAALLERGNIRMLAGDAEAAREDWLAVATRWPDSAAAAAAQANLARLAERPAGR